MENHVWRRRVLITALVAGLGTGASNSLFADKKEMSQAEREEKLNKMAKDLNLTQDQKNQVRAIKDEMYAKKMQLKQDTHQRIRGVLNSEQQVKFDKQLADD